MDIDLTLGTGPSGPVTLSLSKAPHILVAGMTGGGKSVFMHALLVELLEHEPRDLIVVLIDPKRCEFGRYRSIDHLAWPQVASELADVDMALKWVETEMRMRFHRMDKQGARDFEKYTPRPWGRLVVFIDELANLILAGKHLEKRIVNIASMGRAAGIHLVLATQRPSADVITGLIKANVPTRVCLPVISRMESRIVLDASGAEELTEAGSMLVRVPGQRELVRLKGRYVSDEDIDAAVRRATT